MSNPRQPTWPKFVAPLDEMTPSPLAGPGVSKPTARTAVIGTPVSPSTCGTETTSDWYGLVPALPDVARHLRHPVQEEPAARVEDGPVVGGPAIIQANDNPVDWHASYLSFSPADRRHYCGLMACSPPGGWHVSNGPGRRGRS
jgi:hypothetical protein